MTTRKRAGGGYSDRRPWLCLVLLAIGLLSALTTSAAVELLPPCGEEALNQVLHEEPVPGLHVVCLNHTMESLQLTMYPSAQYTDAPLTTELEKGLPGGIASLKTTLAQYLKLTPMDDMHQPWGMYSINGELLMKEDEDNFDDQVERLVQRGLLLLFQGGQFIWPGVRIGFKRTIDLSYTNDIPNVPPKMDGKSDRTATLETLSLNPLVFSVEGFLDEQECQFFQDQAEPTLKYSEVTMSDEDKKSGRPSSDFRTSQNTFLQRIARHPMIQEVDYRTASLVRVPRSHQEHVQVLRYGEGEKYDAHHDYFDKQFFQNDENTLKNLIQYGRRNRLVTVFWYLSDVQEGGETIFPRFGGLPAPYNYSDCSVGLKVKPVKGKVIIFYSLQADGSLDPLSLHGACPVKEGIKWAANKWVWNLPVEFLR